jgi:hypothetical protein
LTHTAGMQYLPDRLVFALNAQKPNLNWFLRAQRKTRGES